MYTRTLIMLYFANDVTLPYVEPLMASSANEQWSQRYVYGAQHERLSMSYIASGDASNDWEPTPGAGGTNVSAAYTDLYYLADVRGSVIGLTNDAGTISARYHYDEFGSMKDRYKLDLNYSGPDNLFGYTGLAYDYASDLSYARARYFDSGLGRFISEDTYEGQINDPLSLNLYTYVLNNPLRYVDPSGHIPTTLEAAYMAQHIYKATEENYQKKATGDWILTDMLTNSEGLKIGVYSKTNANGITEYSLVNAGSTFEGWGIDWLNNAQQPFGYSTDMKDSIAKAIDFVKNYAGYEVTMVGHSKGGAEAAANVIATGKNAILFNPATVNLSKYDLDAGDYNGLMRANIVEGEALNQLFGSKSEPIGRVHYLPTQYKVDTKNPFQNIKNSIQNHGMDAVISALKEAGY